MNEYKNQLSISKLKTGEHSELSTMVDVYSSSLYQLALRITGNPQDAEDILQNTFIKAIRNVKDFEERSSLSTWLYRIAVNETLMALRKQKPEFSLEDMQTDDKEGIPEPKILLDWCCLPEEEFISEETRRMLDEAIQRLPGNLQIVFLLRDIEGLSIQQTSEILSLSEAAVKTRLLRARLHLRESLSHYFYERLHQGKNANA